MMKFNNKCPCCGEFAAAGTRDGRNYEIACSYCGYGAWISPENLAEDCLVDGRAVSHACEVHRCKSQPQVVALTGNILTTVRGEVKVRQ